MAKNWQIRSKAKWIEKGEKSTRYFFQRYATRINHSATNCIKQPSSASSGRKETIDYIADWYKDLYTTETHDPDMATRLINNIMPAS